MVYHFDYLPAGLFNRVQVCLPALIQWWCMFLSCHYLLFCPVWTSVSSPDVMEGDQTWLQCLRSVCAILSFALLVHMCFHYVRFSFCSVPAKFHYAIHVADLFADLVSDLAFNKFLWVCDQLATFESKAGPRQVRATSTCWDSSNQSATCFQPKKVASCSQTRHARTWNLVLSC